LHGSNQLLDAISMLPHEIIQSASNPRVRQAALLRDAAERRATGHTLVDGLRELFRAAQAGVPIVEVFVDEGAMHQPSLPAGEDAPTGLDGWLTDRAAEGTQVAIVSRRAFEKIAFGSRNEGCVGVVRFAGAALADWGAPSPAAVLLVEGVEKPGNLGAILRTADAAGLGGVIVCDGRTDLANPAVIRASLGTVFTVPLACGTTAQAIDWCRTHTRRVIAAMPEGEKLWHAAGLGQQAAILLGSEAHGISSAWREAAAAGKILWETVRLPMRGRADSLNVSATAAVLAYESLRQADSSTPPPSG